MLQKQAQFDDGGNSVEAGVLDMLDRMQTGRFRVAKHLNDFREEFRLYHRKDGRLVKEHDDLISAARYGVMMRRYARTADQAGKRRSVMADNIDYPMFAGQRAMDGQGTGVVWGNGRPAHLERNTRGRNASDNDYDLFNH